MSKTFKAAALAAVLAALAGTTKAADLENTIYLDLKDGRVVIQLRPDLAPKTVARMKELTRQHFFDGIVFHRVIAGFMAQTGDPKGNGTGGSGQTVKAEFNQNAHFLRGTVGLARAANPDSGDSQFFICFKPAPNLDGKYTIFGQVTQGMEFIDAIKKGDPNNNGTVVAPDHIGRMQIAADADKKK